MPLLRWVVALVVSTAVVLFLWQALIWVLDLDPLVAKTPGDVWRHLVTDPDAAAHRDVLFDALRTTVWEAGVGYVVGTVAAVVLALAFVLWRPVAHAVMPVALVLQAVPLSAVTPMLLVVFGRGLLGTTVICAIVTFFPTLVNVTVGFTWVPASALDVLESLGAGRWTVLRKAQVPCAIPAFLASARIAIPRALAGALLAEWIATGRGIGYLMLQSKITYRYAQLWSAVVLSTVTMLAVYSVVSAVERRVLTRYAPDAEALR
jgi:ABC-type nitrate/sulfonate/bicarbonate transport system permease component